MENGKFTCPFSNEKAIKKSGLQPPIQSKCTAFCSHNSPFSILHSPMTAPGFLMSRELEKDVHEQHAQDDHVIDMVLFLVLVNFGEQLVKNQIEHDAPGHGEKYSLKCSCNKWH